MAALRATTFVGAVVHLSSTLSTARGEVTQKTPSPDLYPCAILDGCRPDGSLRLPGGRFSLSGCPIDLLDTLATSRSRVQEILGTDIGFNNLALATSHPHTYSVSSMDYLQGGEAGFYNMSHPSCRSQTVLPCSVCSFEGGKSGILARPVSAAAVGMISLPVVFDPIVFNRRSSSYTCPEGTQVGSVVGGGGGGSNFGRGCDSRIPVASHLCLNLDGVVVDRADGVFGQGLGRTIVCGRSFCGSEVFGSACRKLDDGRFSKLLRMIEELGDVKMGPKLDLVIKLLRDLVELLMKDAKKAKLVSGAAADHGMQSAYCRSDKFSCKLFNYGRIALKQLEEIGMKLDACFVVAQRYKLGKFLLAFIAYISMGLSVYDLWDLMRYNREMKAEEYRDRIQKWRDHRAKIEADAAEAAATKKKADEDAAAAAAKKSDEDAAAAKKADEDAAAKKKSDEDAAAAKKADEDAAAKKKSDEDAAAAAKKAEEDASRSWVSKLIWK